MSKYCKVFAYGSNLSELQMLERCPGAEPLEVAVLVDHELAFSGWSSFRRGGVATAKPSSGGKLCGILYALSPADLKALDAWEGVPFCYNRRSVTVQTASGPQKVWAYFRVEGGLSNPPARGYLELIWRAYEAADWPLEPLAKAAVACGVGWHALFVYGSLLKGLSNHRLLEQGKALFVGPAATPPGFGLWGLGGFPAMRAQPGALGVDGEIWLVDDATLRAVDRLEGHPIMYQREPIVLSDGFEAQTYLYQRSLSGKAIAGGNWRVFQARNC